MRSRAPGCRENLTGHGPYTVGHDAFLVALRASQKKKMCSTVRILLDKEGRRHCQSSWEGCSSFSRTLEPTRVRCSAYGQQPSGRKTRLSLLKLDWNVRHDRRGDDRVGLDETENDPLTLRTEVGPRPPGGGSRSLNRREVQSRRLGTAPRRCRRVLRESLNE